MRNYDNYYQDVISKINHFITEEQWNQAMKLVKHELEMPYIPINFEVTLQELHHNIMTNIRINTKIKSAKWSLEAINQILLNPLDEYLHPVAFYYLQNHNVRLILPTIKTYLASQKFSNINKTQLLFLLNGQNINEEILVVKTHGIFKINPCELIPWQELPVYKTLVFIFENQVHIDNPGIYGICLFLLDCYIENLFPTLPNNRQTAALAAALYIVACSLHFINVTLAASAKKFKTTTILIKKYLEIIKKHKLHKEN